MNEYFRSVVLECTGASAISSEDDIQDLWNGYGKIIRLGLVGTSTSSVVVKHVQMPLYTKHPRGWNTNIGHQRKVKSYEVETHWYQRYSDRSAARIPHCLTVHTHGDEVLIVLEDLNVAGYALRKHSVTWQDIDACLGWLARFHASYMGVTPDGLWEIGTYWHLDTRPEELSILSDQRLRAAAHLIDAKLNGCKYKTCVHGDAKLANFCFSDDGMVAGVDFQYVGGGCGMKDVAYFIGSCLDEQDCDRLESQILDTYFGHLQKALGQSNEALESEWRALYRVAWADFHRFLKGWSPGHWKINGYSERVTAEVINNLS